MTRYSLNAVSAACDSNAQCWAHSFGREPLGVMLSICTGMPHCLQDAAAAGTTAVPPTTLSPATAKPAAAKPLPPPPLPPPPLPSTMMSAQAVLAPINRQHQGQHYCWQPIEDEDDIELFNRYEAAALRTLNDQWHEPNFFLCVGAERTGVPASDPAVVTTPRWLSSSLPERSIAADGQRWLGGGADGLQSPAVGRYGQSAEEGPQGCPISYPRQQDGAIHPRGCQGQGGTYGTMRALAVMT